jgi:hypothetical protein
LIVLCAGDDVLPVRSFAIGSKNFAPFEDGDVELVAVDEAPEVQMWFWTDFSQGALHFGASSKMHKA